MRFKSTKIEHECQILNNNMCHLVSNNHREALSIYYLADIVYHCLHLYRPVAVDSLLELAAIALATPSVFLTKVHYK